MLSEVLAKSSNYIVTEYDIQGDKLKINVIIMEQTKFKRFKRIILTTVLTVLLILSTTFCLSSYQSCSAKTHNIEITDTIHKEGIEMLAVDTVRTQDMIESELIDEVTKYISTKTTRHHQFIPKYLVQAGLNYDIDICFMMAQTQLETCYGTLGAGRESSRRSLFGVAIKRYTNYEDAIKSYCELLHKSYLGQGKTEQHLLTKYVTLRGGRYAENPNYERELSIAYHHIKKNTQIYNLQQEYKNMNTVL